MKIQRLKIDGINSTESISGTVTVTETKIEFNLNDKGEITIPHSTMINIMKADKEIFPAVLQCMFETYVSSEENVKRLTDESDK